MIKEEEAMKRLFILALVMLLTLTACADTDPDQTTGSTTAPTDTTELPKEGVLSVDKYTGEDAQVLAARETVIATLEEGALTNGVLQIYYWTAVRSFLNQYGAYVYYYGLDPSQPLYEQSMSGGGTWEQYFLGQALTMWRQYQVLAAAGKDMAMDPELQAEKDAVQERLAQTAQDEGFDSVEEYLAENVGAGCTLEDYLAYMDLYYRSYNYYQSVYDGFTYTDEQIRTYFQEHQEELARQGIDQDTLAYDVRHILIQPEGAEEDWTDQGWEDCRRKAQALLDGFLAGEATEEAFAALAREHSQDPGSQENGGLYDGLTENENFYEPFKEWYLDEGRKSGDTGLVKTEKGYHIMYFTRSYSLWPEYCRQTMAYEATADVVDEHLEAAKLEVLYDQILLAQVTLMTKSES